MLEHIPLVGVGHRLLKQLELPLIRYENPGIPVSRHLSLSNPISLHSAKLRAPILRYNLSTPTSQIGPEDLVSTCIYIHPIDPLVVVKSASLTIERRLYLHNSTRNHPPPSPVNKSPYLDSHSSTAGLLTPSASTSTATITRNSSFTPAESDSNLTVRPMLSNQSEPPPSPIAEGSKTVTNAIVNAEAANFSRDSAGMWSKTITVQWPPRKKHSWATGETLTSEIATVRFYIRIKVSERDKPNALNRLSIPSTALCIITKCWNRVHRT